MPVRVCSSAAFSASVTSTQDLHATTEGNFLDRPADGLKQRLRFSGFKSVGSLPGSRGLSSVEGGEISLDNMKVTPALVLVAVFLSQEWKSALSDSIIHIGELLRFSSRRPRLQ